jgi:hypothetical protein
MMKMTFDTKGTLRDRTKALAAAAEHAALRIDGIEAYNVNVDVENDTVFFTESLDPMSRDFFMAVEVIRDVVVTREEA